MALIIKTTGFEEYLDQSGGAYIKALIMGSHGTGKTRSASFWPKPIFADFEQGLMSVADRKVPYATIKTVEEMDALLRHLALECKKPVENRQYQTLVLDTIDAYQRIVIQQRLRTERKESFSGYGDWGYLDAKMQQLVERLLNLPMNIVVNMHTKDQRDGDDDNSLLVKQARLKGDIKDSIYQDFDLIGQMETSYESVKGERVLKRQIRWHAEPRFPNLRDRSGRLPRFTDVDFTPDDFQRIFDAITSDLDALPESAELETLEVEGDGTEVGEPPASGGPVANPEVPRKKAAKKAAAKRAAPKEPKPEPQAEAPPAQANSEADAERESPPEEIDSGPNGKGTADEPIIVPQGTPAAMESKIKEAGEHVHASDGQCLKNAFGEPCDMKAAVDLATEKLGATAVEPESEKPAAPANPNARTCGMQPPTMADRFPAATGCGIELTGDNSASIAMVKAKTFLCNGCYERFQQA